MQDLLTYEVAVCLMIAGVIPSLVNIYLLWDDRKELGVFWFILSMATGGLWAILYTALTVIPSPKATLLVANFFWPLVPTAAATMFLLAYEFVFKQPVSRKVVVVLFAPIAVLFVLSWTNPNDLVFTADYYVDQHGYLHFPNFGGPVKFVVTKVYGYLLVALASGMFVGEAMRTDGIRRKRVLYLLAIFTMLILSTMVKVAGLVPVFFDPTSVVYSASGLMFAYSINKYGIFKSISIGREQTFEEVNDAIIVIDADGVVVDVNQRGCDLFRETIVGDDIESVIPQYDATGFETELEGIQLIGDETDRYFHCKTTPVKYGRKSEGRILILSDVTTLKKQEQELHLLVQIFSRVYRHNMRNEFNIIKGYADILKTQPEDEVAQMAEQIDQKADVLLKQANKARQIEKIFLIEEMVSRSLQEIVDDVQSPFANRPEATITTAVDDVSVEVNPRFDLALDELIDNAITHHPTGETAEVDIWSETFADTVDLVVSDNGTGISEYELSVLRAAEETELHHSSGIGLWLVRAVATRSKGELSVESNDDGTTVRITLPKSSSDHRGKRVETERRKGAETDVDGTTSATVND